MDNINQGFRYSVASVGIIDNAREWCLDGWGLDCKPSPEQIAAALLMEANDQDECVHRGESHMSYPMMLRNIAFDILEVAHRGKKIEV